MITTKVVVVERNDGQTTTDCRTETHVTDNRVTSRQTIARRDMHST